MKSLTIRLSDSLLAEIEDESRSRRVSKSDVVRERLTDPQRPARAGGSMRDLAGDLLGSVRGLPADLSSNKKKYLPELIRAKMSETLPDPVVLTIDADFRIYRRHSRQVVPCLLP